MKSAEVVLLLAFATVSVYAGIVKNEDNSITETVSNDTTVTEDPVGDMTTIVPPGENSTATNAPKDEETTVQSDKRIDVKSESSSTSTTTSTTTRKPTSTLSQNGTTPSGNKTSTLTGTKKGLSVEIDAAKCRQLGLIPPHAPNCKCYKQRSPGTDLPPGYCYYYQCDGPTLSRHKCEFHE